MTLLHELLSTCNAAPPRRRQQPERELLHVPVCQPLGWRAHPAVVWWHTPSGGSRHKIEAANLRRMGARKGLPDLLLLHDGQLHALELKNGKRGRISPAQSEMLIALAKAGCRTAVARDLDEALEVLEHWNLIRGDGGRS
jgi:VRR-NUC domain